MQTATIPAPTPTTAPGPRTPSAIALTKFGTVGFDLYLAVVLAEEQKRAAVMMKGCGR